MEGNKYNTWQDNAKTDILEGILHHPTWDDKTKIDELLKIDCMMYTNLGTDSSDLDRQYVKSKSAQIYETIKKIDHDSGVLLLETNK